MMGDGMVSMGNTIVKPNARKICHILPKKSHAPSVEGEKKEDEDEGTIVGFAGTTSDEFTLLERLEDFCVHVLYSNRL